MGNRIIAVGINHKTAPVAVRERFSLTPTQQDLLLSELKNHPQVIEAFVLSTCNRVEIYAHILDKLADIDFFMELIFSIKAIPFNFGAKQYFYSLFDQQAIQHLFRVTTGLDSLILGEKEILGQVKTAVARAQTMGMFSQYFNILANVTIRTGKKAHHETDISYGGSSVSWASIVMAERTLTTLAGKSILIIGAGKMGELTIKQIQNESLKKIYLMNRTEAIARELARRYNGHAVSFSDIKEILGEVDVCICASNAPHYILDSVTLKRVMAVRKNRRLLLIDISVPRNIDPRIADFINVDLFTIDDLEEVVNQTLRKRETAIHHVEALIDQKLVEFTEKIKKNQDLTMIAS